VRINMKKSARSNRLKPKLEVHFAKQFLRCSRPLCSSQSTGGTPSYLCLPVHE
jgi:hypothetical protein